MPTFDNPYGIAVFSACVWPYLFKHAGFKFFTQYAEKFGVPFMIAKHPAGWSGEQVDALVEALAKLANNAVGAVEDGAEMLAMPAGGGGGAAQGTPQERLIRACNTELSKALTSQTLATEVQGQGSRAASETHLQREQSVHVSDRAMISSTLNALFRAITDINLGAHVPAPTHHFYEQDEAREDWGRLIAQARHFMPIKAEEAYERIGLTPPGAGDELLPAPGVHTDRPADPRGGAGMKMSACPSCGAYHFNAGAGDAGGGAFEDDLLAAVDDILVRGQDAGDIGADLARPLLAADPAQLQTRLAELYPDIDAADLQDALARLMFAATLLGRAADDGEDHA